MIKRDHYLNQLILVKENGFPKVISGIRRCGKSYLLKEIYREYLIANNIPAKNILYIDLDSDTNILLRNPLNLATYIRKYCNKNTGMNYVFIDEIQMVFPIINPSLTDGKFVLANKNDKEIVSFIDVILGLSRETNIDLYVTCSNSKMLSSDIVTEFRDKASNIKISPLSFSEYYDYFKTDVYQALNEYMIYGGMPLAVLKQNEQRREYLKDLFETTYFKDIIEHNNLYKSESLNELCNIISPAQVNF